MNIRIARERPRLGLRIRREPAPVAPVRTGLWNLHTHSNFSHKDALSTVQELVATAAGFGQPAIGLTDHGNMAGAVQLYKACKAAGMAPFPGSELYVVTDHDQHRAAMNARGETPRHLKRHHFCVVAYTSKGYENLVGLSTLSHQRFFNKPVLDHGDLAMLAEQGLLEGIAATSGCFFGLIAQAVVTGEPEHAMSLLKTYAGWFPGFYVELQNHHIDHSLDGFEGWNDDKLADTLHQMAYEAGLPVVLTQDAHYAKPEQKQAHEILKRLVAFGPEADDAVFPGDGFHLADDAWFAAHHHAARLSSGADGLADLLAAHELAIPELDTYHYNIPFTVAEPQKELALRVGKAMLAAGLDQKQKYLDRFLDELSIVKDTGMAGYLMLVAEVTDWCRANHVFYRARGSAAGSLLCWQLGITPVVPLKWGLRFERFISRVRTSPPDIDLDVEYDRRGDLIAWLRTRFSVQQIGTHAKFSMTGEEDVEGEADARGSILVAYFARQRATGGEITEWSDVPAQDRTDLHTLDAEAALKSYGTHAAGLVLTTTAADFDRLMPLMWVASSGIFVTQHPMKDVEGLGYVKLDVLGLKTLAVLHRCMDNLGRQVSDGLEWIPLNDRQTFAAISRGHTDGVFQLEGGSARWGCKDLKPSHIRDVIAAMALFRPAAMETGATKHYIARKHKVEAVPVRHKVIADNTAKTYGIMLYQEQVIAILRDLGMEPEPLTKFLKAVKASQKSEMAKAAQTMADAKAKVAAMADEAGMSHEDFVWLWDAIEGFSKYGFNQAHATVYGQLAYYCAYLSVHHPVEFFAALLAVAAESGSKKETGYVSAARGAGVRILRPDVNASGVTYAVDPRRKGVRRGLVAIKGIGEKQARHLVAQRPEGGFTTLQDLCERVYVPGSPVSGLKPYLKDGDDSVGTIGKLKDAGALETLEER